MTNFPVILELAMAGAGNLTVRRRILLYRELTEFCGLPSQAAEFQKLANDLEAAEARHQELALHFAEGKAGKGTFHFHCGEFVDQAAAAKAGKGAR